MSEPQESLRQQACVARARIRSGALRGAELRELLVAVPFVDRNAWVDELLAIEPPPPDQDLPRGAVPYLPCDVEAILAMVSEAPVGPDDNLVDLGSGLGRVVILAHLLTGATALGVEIQEHLIHSSRARADELALDRVSFVHANAADIRLDGSVFLLYAPFNGEMLTRVLHRLEEVARRRPITVCTVDLELDVPWLSARPSSSVALTIYDSSC
jgi:SAM-dependent methyltransferase